MHDRSTYCFSALALGSFYRELAIELARDLAIAAPGIPLVLLTDVPKTFTGIDNVIPIAHQHYFGYRPYNDKVFVLEEALKRFLIAIQIDVDTRITEDILDKLDRPWLPGITARTEPLMEHTKRHNSRDLFRIEKAAANLAIPLEKAQWVAEAMFVVRKDNGKEKEFLETWKKLARYWDIYKLAAKDGTLIGMAAASVGWDAASSPDWQDLNACLYHFDAHKQLGEDKYAFLKRKWDYRSRIWRTKLSVFFQPELLP